MRWLVKHTPFMRCVIDESSDQTKSDENGFIINYRYDAAGRLAEVTTTGVHTYAYGASNQRLQMMEAGALGSTAPCTRGKAGVQRSEIGMFERQLFRK